MDRAVEALFARTTQGIRPGLDTIMALLEALGNPHQRLAVVHVAGTNGKGSVCAMMESVLRASGFKTGLYTSPHLVEFSERFRINGEQISDERLMHYIDRVVAASDSLPGRRATFFEISTAIAFLYFAEEGVQLTVIETGMGGRWDATNVVIPLLSVITHIDIDHTNFLGDSIEEIAAEKAGIIKPGRPVVVAPQNEAALAELKKASEPLIPAGEAVSVQHVDEASCLVGITQKLKIETQNRRLSSIRLPLLGACQRENCAVAVAAIEVLADLIEFEPEFKAGLESVSWGARFQQVNEAPVMILDGAHNPSAARAMVKTLKEVAGQRTVGFVFGFLDDKESVEFIRTLKPWISAAWTVPIDAPRGLSAEDAAVRLGVAGCAVRPLPVIEAWQEAQAWAKAEPDRMVLITGSLYLKQALRAAGLLDG